MGASMSRELAVNSERGMRQMRHTHREREKEGEEENQVQFNALQIAERILSKKKVEEKKRGRFPKPATFFLSFPLFSALSYFMYIFFLLSDLARLFCLGERTARG